MSFKDFIKPTIYRSNRHYLGKALHKKQFIIYLVLQTTLFALLYIASHFNGQIILFWLGFTIVQIVLYFTFDVLADKYEFQLGEKLLGKSKINSDPEIHRAIKSLENDRSTKNKERVQKLTDKNPN